MKKLCIRDYDDKKNKTNQKQKKIERKNYMVSSMWKKTRNE